MSAKRLEKSKQKTDAEALASCTGLIKASLCRTRIKCGKHSCRCANDERFRHQNLTLTWKHKARSMGLHVPKDMEEPARRAVQEYWKLKRLIQRLSDSNLKKFRLACARRRNPAAMKTVQPQNSHA